MAFLAGWSVSGKRIEVQPGFRKFPVVVDGRAVGELKGLPASAPFDIDGRQFTVGVKQVMLSRQFSLSTAGGIVIPQALKHVPVTPAPAVGPGCKQHFGRRAEITCPQCGSPECAECTAADGTHCATCFTANTTKAATNQADMALAVPAFLFGIMGGLLGGLLGGGAAALSVMAAKKLKSTPAKWLAAFGIYSAAAVLYFICAVALAMVLHKHDAR